jgi:hypothetical protein
MANRAEPDRPQGPGNSPRSAGPPDAKTPSRPEASAPMLEVHAPHQSIHTWKDFLIQLATIVFGLIIAVGLEQSVEAVHRGHEVAALREDLHAESLQIVADARRAEAAQVYDRHRPLSLSFARSNRASPATCRSSHHPISRSGAPPRQVPKLRCSPRAR